MPADPALIYWDEADRPGTHVLLVGIGDYPFLEDGNNYDPDEHEENAMGMGQLAAPPHSMQLLADWFLERYQNSDRELASLGLVLSGPQPITYKHARRNTAEAPCPRGTADDVAKAAANWIKRAGVRRDSSLIFAFCGHGIHSGEPVLLCRDYGENTEQRFGGAINFEQFRIAASTRSPDQQVFFVDACRTPDTELELLGQASPGNSLIDVKSLAQRGEIPAAQSVHYATSLYTQAWGREDGPSLFIEALIKALEGGAAENTAEWWVTTSRLQTVLNTYLHRSAGHAGVMQRPVAETQEFRLHKPQEIAVDLYVTSEEPGIWHESVCVEAMRGNVLANTVTHQPPPDTEPFELALRLVNPSQKPADCLYKVHAKFAAQSQYLDCDEDVIAYPPLVGCVLPVSRRL